MFSRSSKLYLSLNFDWMIVRKAPDTQIWSWVLLTDNWCSLFDWISASLGVSSHCLLLLCSWEPNHFWKVWHPLPTLRLDINSPVQCCHHVHLNVASCQILDWQGMGRNNQRPPEQYPDIQVADVGNLHLLPLDGAEAADEKEFIVVSSTSRKHIQRKINDKKTLLCFNLILRKVKRHHVKFFSEVWFWSLLIAHHCQIASLKSFRCMLFGPCLHSLQLKDLYNWRSTFKPLFNILLRLREGPFVFPKKIPCLGKNNPCPDSGLAPSLILAVKYFFLAHCFLLQQANIIKVSSNVALSTLQ